MKRNGEKTKEQLKRLEKSLTIRVKELQCLYGLTEIVQRTGGAINEKYQEIVDLLPQGWQYTEVACAQLTIDGKEFKTTNYRETKWKQSTDVQVRGVKAGTIGVGYLEERPASDEGPFLKEERLLIGAIAERLAGIIERIRAEEETQEVNKLLNTVVNASTALVWMSGTDKLCTWFNKPWLDFTGRSMEQELGNGWTQGVHADDFETCLRTYVEAFDNRQPFTMEYRLRHHTGTYRWVFDRGIPHYDTKGNFVGYVGSALDISERKQAEEALRISEENFHRSIEESPFGIHIVTAEGETLYANRALLDMWGYSTLRELEATPQQERYTPEEYLVYKERMAKQQKGEFVPVNYEVSIKRKNGEVRHLSVSRKDIPWNGSPQFQVIYQDITERKIAEEVIRSSEEKFAKAFHTSPNLMAITTLEEGRIIEINEAFCKVLGYKRKECLGHNTRELKIWADPEQRNRVVCKVKEEGYAHNFTADLRTRSGEIRSIIDSMDFISINNQKYLLSVAMDITELKHIEEALQKSEARLHLMFESAIDGIIEADLAGNLVQVNNADVKLHGYSRKEEMLGHSAYEFIAERERPGISLALKRVIEEGQIRNVEYHFIKKDGSEFPVEISASVLRDSSGNPFGIIGIIKDITERKRFEEALIRFRKAIESSSDAIWMSDPQGHHVYHNKAFNKLFEYTPEELEAAGGDLAAFADKDVASEVFRVIISGGSWNGEVEMVSKSGRKFMALERADAITDESGRVIGLVGIHTDITERKRADEDHQRVAKLESIGTLAGGIAHDFNNILTGILGNVQLVKNYLGTNETNTAKEILDEAEKASLRARDLTQQLLTFSRGGAPVKKVIRINNLIKESATFALRGSNAKPEFAIPDNLWAVEADDGQITQVISNIIINAGQAMPDGGIINIKAGNVVIGEEHILPLPGGNYIELDIEDHGIGIPKSHFDKIFDPYFTTKQKGSGLGLATTYSIIKNHGGHITFDSELGVGTTFHVYLPVTKEKLKKKKKTAAATKPMPSTQGKILVMDDEETILTLLGRMLKSAGYEVEVTRDGAEATERYTKAKESEQNFDAVILDLTVPGGIGGKDVIAKLLEIDPGVKAIVSSGYAKDPIIAEFRKYGFSGVVIKPYNIKQMQETLRDVLADK